MKFGCITSSNLPKVDFSLPADAPATQTLLSSLSQPTQPPAIYVGCSVWTERSFVGKLYPPGSAAKDYLRLYSQQFNTVELNATFYSLPSVTQVKKWKVSVAPGFKFCPKVPQSISHTNNPSEQLRQLANFLETIQHLEEALGITFLQLPPYFEPNRIPTLQKLLDKVPEGLPWAVELRHPAWFSNPVAQRELFDFLQQRGMVAVISDVAGRRDALHQTLTTGCAFIRFQGYPEEPSNYTRLDAWIGRIQQWLAQGLEQVYWVIHETDKALCVDLAIYVIKQLNHQLGLQLSVPRLAAQQASLF